MDRRLDRHVRRAQGRGLEHKAQSRWVACGIGQCGLYSVRILSRISMCLEGGAVDGLALRLVARSGIRTADIRSTPSHITTSFEVSRSPRQPHICLPEDKKKKSEYSTSGNQMRSQMSYPRAMGNRTMAQLRALYGLTRTAL
jgi:hypothetical protein